jgi:hypothetical protein
MSNNSSDFGFFEQQISNKKERNIDSIEDFLEKEKCSSLEEYYTKQKKG